MANTKLSGLTAASATADADLFYTAQGGTSKKATALQLKTYCSASPTLVTPTLGVAAGTSLALGGATIGANALAVTGSGAFSGAVTATAFSASVQLIAPNTGPILWSGRSVMTSPSDGTIMLATQGGSAFGLLQLGGATSSFPAIKRSSAALAFRLADDSADAAITAAGATLSGVLKLGNAYVATPQVTTGYVTLQDSTGTTYKVCVAT